MWDIATSTIGGSLLGSGVLLLPTLAIALLYAHGRYLPLWLPDLGLLGAYGVHAAWSGGVSPWWALTGVLLAAASLGVLVHQMLLIRFIESDDALSCLLIGVGLSAVFQSIASMYGRGMSQHFPANPLDERSFSDWIGTSVHRADLACLAVVGMTVAITAVILGRTRWGLRIKAVIADRSLARHFRLPVGRLDVTVVSMAVTFAVLGAIFRGLRYDLQPRMMFFPALVAVAACVSAGPGRLYLPLAVAAAMQVLGGLVGAMPTLSPAQRAVPFIVVLILLIVHAYRRSAPHRHAGGAR